MSSCSSDGWWGWAEGAVVAQQCPQDIDQAPGQVEQGLGVDAMLCAFALVERSGWSVGATCWGAVLNTALRCPDVIAASSRIGADHRRYEGGIGRHSPRGVGRNCMPA